MQKQNFKPKIFQKIIYQTFLEKKMADLHFAQNFAHMTMWSCNVHNMV